MQSHGFYQNLIKSMAKAFYKGNSVVGGSLVIDTIVKHEQGGLVLF